MKQIYIFLVISLFSGKLCAQTLEFPLDTNMVTVDGIMQPSEWSNAETVMIGVNTVDNIQVMYKHDNTAMHFAFTGKLESANMLFPEVLIDPQNIGGSSWSIGQWWFHVSATDCENDTAYGMYSNCMAVQPDWEGAPNFTPGNPMTDTVEISIPFSKIGFDPATMDTMGMVMMVTNTSTAFHTYPGTADKDVPDTWTKATFSKVPAAIPNNKGKKSNHSIYPNPAGDILYISGMRGDAVASVIDMQGNIFAHQRSVSASSKISVRELPPGIYIIEVIEERSEVYRKLFAKQ